MTAISDLISSLETRVDPLSREICEVYWEMANTGNEELHARMVELEMGMHAIFSDAQAFATIREALADEQYSGETRRVLELLHNEFAGSQESEEIARRKAELSTSIDGDYANFRAELNGEKLSANDILDVLKHCNASPVRKATWQAAKRIGPVVAPKILELVELRNRTARELDYRDYYDMSLKLQEIDEHEMLTGFRKLEELTREPFAALKAGLDARLVTRFRLGSTEELRPWHYEDPFFQEAPAIVELDLDSLFAGADLEKLTTDTFDRIGLDIRPSLAISDLYERENKDQHAFCMMVGRDPSRVHVLCNCRDNESWAATMLHEYGHAVYDMGLDPLQQYFLRDCAHISSTEAIAMLFGRLTHDEAWLVDILGVDSAKAAAASADARRQQSWAMLLFVRWMMVMVNFERSLYNDPSQDLNKLWWDLVGQYQMVTRPDNRDEPDWATKTHIAQAPVYYQNYLLGEMTASQLKHYIEHKLGNEPLVRQPRTGEWLRDGLFRRGSLLHWNETLRELTGERLNPQYFIDDFVSQQEAGA
ncbi:MAG: M2 family metallopeptidase [Planctomycetales bacterium]|nr:M2 family metallopeptidase [bacterium]UNM08499.1 MAG: M2 family metallopeptidase [Planctomycetales bacterium]